MSDHKEDPAGQSAPKVHVQIGRFRPVSDRYPQLFADEVDYEIVAVWMVRAVS
jgi:hypothetical protein